MFLTKTNIDDVPVSMKITELVLELGQKKNIRKQYILSVSWDEVLSRIAFNYVYLSTTFRKFLCTIYTTQHAMEISQADKLSQHSL